MRVLVTGGAGYIGSHCVKLLMKSGFEVVVLDNLLTGHRSHILSPHFVEGSVHDSALVTSLLRDYQIQAVMHFASSCYVGESVTNPALYYNNNIVGAIRLLDAMQEAGVNKFIFSSSCATYGNPQYLPLDEQHPLNPVNPYGFTKRVIEEMLKDYSTAYGFKYISFRYFNASGADPSGEIGEHHIPETHLIPLVLQTALGKRPVITINGYNYETSDGTCIRDYIHINDIAQAHYLGVLHLLEGHESNVFNIGTETGTTILEVIRIAETVTGTSIPIAMGERRPGDPPTLVASAKKIKEVLGWEPAYKDLRTIIETAWQWEQKLSGKTTIELTA